MKKIRNLRELQDLLLGSSLKLEQLYNHLNGGYFALFSFGVCIGSIFVAYLLYSAVGQFSFFSHWISDLGSGPNGANLAFNYGVMLTSLFLFFFQYDLMRDLKKQNVHSHLRKLSQICCCCSLGGLFFVGLFPLSYSEILHGIAASFYFYGSFFWSLTFSILELKTKNIPKYQVFLGFIVGFFYFNYNVVAIGTLMIPLITEEIVKFSEWLTLFVSITWVLIRGIFTLLTSSTGIYTIAISARGIYLKKVIK